MKLVASLGQPALFAFIALSMSWAVGEERGSETAIRTGVAAFEPAQGENDLPSRFRLQSHTFQYEMRRNWTAADRFKVWDATFPSPVVTEFECNNTVHCEFFQPAVDGKRPAVVVLHILGGDFPLSRLFCHSLALKGTAALFVKMPYYGPRRPEGVPRRMVSKNPEETVEGMTQAVLDVRRAAAWLTSQEEIDPKQLGIFGISLGGITSSLSAAIEPRFRNVCTLLAGGDIARIGWESKELTEVRDQWVASGKTYEDFIAIMRQIDPVVYGDRLRDRRILMLNGSRDEVIPPSCTVSLWESMGKPEIVWYDCGHYSAAYHLLDALGRVQQFFAVP